MTRGPGSGGGEDKHTSIRKIKVRKVENRNKAFKKKKKCSQRHENTAWLREERWGTAY